MTKELSKLIFGIHELSDRLDGHYRKEAMVLLAKVIKFDSGVWASGTHNPHRLNSVHLHNQPQALIALYEREFLFKQDFVRQAAVQNPGKAVRLSELKSRSDFEKMLTYKVLCRPLGIEQAMALTRINAQTGLSEYIALWRKEPNDAYLDEDVEMLEIICPHLFLGEQRWLRGNLTVDNNLDKVRSYALFDTEGTLHVADSCIGDHFKSSWPDWSGPVVPTPILQIGRLCRDVGGVQVLNTIDKRRYEVKPYECPFIGHAYKLNVVHDAGMTILTLREAEVAKLYAKGLTHKEIARNLGSAPSTVRNQCMAALRKLGLHNKAELANRIGNH